MRVGRRYAINLYHTGGSERIGMKRGCDDVDDLGNALVAKDTIANGREHGCAVSNFMPKCW